MKKMRKAPYIIATLIGIIVVGGCVIIASRHSKESTKVDNKANVVSTSAISTSAIKIEAGTPPTLTTNKVTPTSIVVNKDTVEWLKIDNKFKDNFTSTVYNVDEKTKFKLNFKNKNVPEDAIEVYTDISLNEKYKSDINVKNVDGVLEISPKKCTIVASDRRNETDYEYWGDANTYYIVCKYDINSDRVDKLDEPLVIPFTVKNKISTPVLSYDITDKGRLKLIWNNIENVDGYRIYKTSADGDKQYPVLQSQTKKGITEWSDWLLDKNNGVYKSKDKKTVIMQNAGLSGSYSITAYNKDGESRFSNSIDISQLGEVLPVKINNKILTSGKTVESIDKLPAKVEVENIDGSINKFEVKYTIDEKTKYKNKVYYRYEVKHTYLGGYVKVKIKKGSKIHDVIDNGLTIDVGDKIEYINNTKSFDKEYLEYSLEESKQKENIESSIEDEKARALVNNVDKEDIRNNSIKSEDKTIDLNKHIEVNKKKADRDCDSQEFIKNEDVNYDNVYEQYIATRVYELVDRINIRGFNKLSQVVFLDDIMQKVIYQNPKLNIIKSYSYDAESGDIVIDYKYDKKEIKSNISKIDTKIKDICKGSENLSDEDKVAKIYNYVSNNIKYDKKALESLKKNKFRGIDKEYEKSEGVYNAILKSRALGKGYADAFKVCCDYLGVECKVVSGYMYKTIPHTWNIVKIDDEWLNVDCTNNVNNTGINRFVYLASYKTLKTMKYSFSSQFELNDNIDNLKSTDDSKEYYNVNGLVAKDLQSYTKILEKQLNGNNAKIVIRYTGNDMEYSKISQEIVKVFKKTKKEDKLSNLKFGFGDGYYILWFK